MEDDHSVREGMKALLESAGYRVRTFESAMKFIGSDALPDTQCVVSDVRMEGIDGLEMQHRLKAAGYSIPIIFITAHDPDAVRPQAIGAGAIDVLIKPFAAGELLACLRKALGNSAATSGAAQGL